MATFTKRIGTGTADGYNTAATTYVSNTASMTIGNDGSLNYNNGFLFSDVTIPKGSTINSAKLTLYNYTGVNRLGTDCKVKIYGVDEDNFGGFSSSADGVPSGVTRTTANTSWTIPGWNGGADDPKDTPDITTAVQEIIDRAGWSSGNAMGIVFINDGSSTAAYRQINAYDHDTTNCTLLTIDYTAPAATFIPQIIFI